MQSELIVSTYNSPRTLALTLLSAALQRVRPDSIAVADDGSGPETEAVVQDFISAFPDIAIRHIWHPDNGFQKCAILNKAAQSAECDHLVFTDGDCLLAPNFISRHREFAGKGRYTCGSLIRLNPSATDAVTATLVRDGSVFDLGWLRSHGVVRKASTWLKTAPLPFAILSFFEQTSPVDKTFCGANAACHRADLLAVNGFDESYTYGGLDKEFGIRLQNLGVRGRHIRFSAPLVHMDHPRGYFDPERKKAQARQIAQLRRTGRSWTPDGIEKQAA